VAGVAVRVVYVYRLDRVVLLCGWLLAEVDHLQLHDMLSTHRKQRTKPPTSHNTEQHIHTYTHIYILYVSIIVVCVIVMVVMYCVLYCVVLLMLCYVVG